MVGNSRVDYLYSVGGRIRMGETAEEAVVREVEEETGVRLRVQRLLFVHENLFYGDSPSNLGKLVYELSFYYLMETPPDFAPAGAGQTDLAEQEFLCWAAPDTPQKLYPDFFRTELDPLPDTLRFFRNDERIR